MQSARQGRHACACLGKRRRVCTDLNIARIHIHGHHLHVRCMILHHTTLCACAHMHITKHYITLHCTAIEYVALPYLTNRVHPVLRTHIYCYTRRRARLQIAPLLKSHTCNPHPSDAKSSAALAFPAMLRIPKPCASSSRPNVQT